MKTAYSYVRFSSKPQDLGDSERRQLTGARTYAKRRTLPLDESMKDLGVSAYRGGNKKAALGRFLTAVKMGKVERGSVLIVESLDRLSRQEPLDAFDTFREILRAGVEIVSLMPELEFSETSVREKPYLLQILLTLMQRAHEESETKSLRVSGAWREKQKHAKDKPLTRRTPGWIRLMNGKFELVPQAVATLKRMVKLAMAGHGYLAIARKFNATHVPTLSTKGVSTWDYGTVQNILRSRRLMGEYQPGHRVGNRNVPDGEPITGYYPAVLSEAEYYALQAALNTRTKRVRGRGGNTARNLFGNLLYSTDGSRMVLGWNKVKTCYLQSVNGLLGAADYVSFPYDHFEFHFLKWVTELQLESDRAPDEDTSALEVKRAKVRGRMAELRAAIRDNDAANVPELVSLMRDFSDEDKALGEQINKRKADAAKKRINTTDVAALVREAETLPSAERADVRVRIRGAIADLVERVILRIIKNDLNTDRYCWAHVEFANGTHRLFMVGAIRTSRGHRSFSITDGISYTTMPPVLAKICERGLEALRFWVATHGQYVADEDGYMRMTVSVKSRRRAHSP